MKNIQKNIKNIKSTIGSIQEQYHINHKKITLVAISKSQPIEKIKEAIESGQQHFGESYLKEALEKIEALKNEQAIWHYIGRIQSKKTKLISSKFDWVQSVAKFESAELLNKYRPSNMPSLNICIQVNISEDPNKDGVLTDEIAPLAKKIATETPKLKLRGLMTIPAYHENFEQQLSIFKQMSEEFKKLQKDHPHIDTLSMGMSHDFKAAIIEGATMVRIGSAIFGERIMKYSG